METRGSTSLTSCKDFEADLVLLHYGELDGLARRTVEEHLEKCLDCRAAVEQMAKLMPLTIERDDPPTAFWIDYSREVRQKVDKMLERRSCRMALGSWLNPIPIAALSACAVALLALMFTFGKDYWSPARAPDDEVIVSSPQDLDLLQHLEILDALDVIEDMNSDSDTV